MRSFSLSKGKLPHLQEDYEEIPDSSTMLKAQTVMIGRGTQAEIPTVHQAAAEESGEFISAGENGTLHSGDLAGTDGDENDGKRGDAEGGGDKTIEETKAEHEEEGDIEGDQEGQHVKEMEMKDNKTEEEEKKIETSSTGQGSAEPERPEEELNEQEQGEQEQGEPEQHAKETETCVTEEESALEEPNQDLQSSMETHTGQGKKPEAGLPSSEQQRLSYSEGGLTKGEQAQEKTGKTSIPCTAVTKDLQNLFDGSQNESIKESSLEPVTSRAALIDGSKQGRHSKVAPPKSHKVP